MGTVTANMGIYIPSAGETNYDSSFAAGQINIDLHDHSGPPNNGVPLSSSGFAPFSVTRDKLNANVVLAGGGLAVDGGSPNALKVDGVLLGIFNIAGNGVVVKTGAATAAARVLTGTANQISVSNGDGVAGNPTFAIATDPVLPGQGSVTVPIGTTGQRPGAPVNGMIRYNSSLNQVEAYENGAWTPLGARTGQVLQVQTVSTSALITCTTQIPVIDTIPTISQGDLVLTLPFTPQSSTSILYFTFDTTAASGGAGYSWTQALFRDAGPNALCATQGGSNFAFSATLTFSEVSGSTTARTYTIRIGPQLTGSGQTIYVNGDVPGTRVYGGVAGTSLTIMEVAA